MNKNNSDNMNGRPSFPKRAVITGGMPYGNKELHFGHIGAVFELADTYARFLRDRIGKDNVIFVSGTDCYGSPALVDYRKFKESGIIEGSIEDFVESNHKQHKKVLAAYDIYINLFAASAFGRAAEIHRGFSKEIMTRLYENGHLLKVITSEFYDAEYDTLLNGRQVVGQCPIQGCASEKGYADECALGHQYMPKDLINPKSTLSGNTPEMRDVANWYVDMEKFRELLTEWVTALDEKNSRPFIAKSIKEFLEPPVIYVKLDDLPSIREIVSDMPPFEIIERDKNKPSVLVFKTLKQREDACSVLTRYKIRFRTGKTLVPFRLSGNVEWGVAAPVIEDLDGLTFWVWPESLWAPISFTKTYLESIGKDNNEWKNWWCSKDAEVYQFIGQDCIYFYGPAEMAIFMGMQGTSPESIPKEGDIQIPNIIANNYILFLNKKASSSGEIKPPIAMELLNYYTAEQLRAHFLGLGLGIRSVSFQPKPLNPDASEKDNDPVLKEGNLLTNVFNRVVRSYFYTLQQYFNGKIPVGEISADVLEASEKVILDYEKLMSKFEFHNVMNLMDSYIRNINKHWSANTRADDSDRFQTMVDTLQMIRTATVLMHPIAPSGTEMILDYLNFDIQFSHEFWNWDRIFDTIYDFIVDKENHRFKVLEPQVDFFKKHPSQLS